MVVLESKLSIKQWLGLRGMSQIDLSKKTGVTTDTINKFCNDPDVMKRARYTTLRKIADALEIKVEDFKELD